MSVSAVPSLEELVRVGWLTGGDAHFARLCVSADESSEPGMAAPEERERGSSGSSTQREARDALRAITIAATSRALRQGHACLPLSALAESEVVDESGVAWGRLPGIAQIRAALRGMTAIGQAQGELLSESITTPLLLDESERLYIARFLDHERTLARRVAELVRANCAIEVDLAWLESRLLHYFPPQDDGENLQAAAARMAVASRFSVITGGPGTGKTSTVVKILALLAEQAKHAGASAPHVQLLAPTGKAAARMMEAIAKTLETLPVEESLKKSIARTSSTIHRALGVIADNPNRFQRGRTQRLRADVVIVDEASMVDLALMRRLVDALKDDARLVLLGDRHQLASVQAGSVLAELCGAELQGRGVVIELEKSYRFAEGSGIATLAQALKNGDSEACLKVAGGTHEDLRWEIPGEDLAASSTLKKTAIFAYRDALRRDSAHGVLEAMDAFRVLCAHRKGPFGVERVNELLVKWLTEAGLIARAERGERTSDSSPFYRGRLILITENDYDMGLHNGDTGLVWPDQSGRLAVFVQGEGGRLRTLSPAQLPSHDTAFALTIHKSQGSEYGEVAVVLPETGSPLLTRELVYTAVTRAKNRVHLLGTMEALAVAAQTSVTRHSGFGASAHRALR